MDESEISCIQRTLHIRSHNSCVKRDGMLTTIRWNKVKCIFVISLFYFVLHKIPTHCCYSVRVKSGGRKGVSLRHIVE